MVSSLTAPPLALLFVLLTIPQIAFVGAVRAYPQGCSQSDFSYYDYDSLPLPPPFCSVKTTDDYLLTRRLGTGKFSDVFEALAVCSRDQTPEPTEEQLLCVIKCLKPVTERKIRRELLVLHRCRDIPNLARLQAVVLPQHRSTPATTSTTCLVMEHAGRDAQWLCHPSSSSNRSNKSSNTISHNSNPEEAAAAQEQDYLSDYEIRYYLCHLLVALDGLHAAGIMHRDVKPRNVLINRQYTTQQISQNSQHQHTTTSPPPPPLMLIDLGLADFYVFGVLYNVRVASRHYKAPELLTGLESYDYAVDLWGVGCILAGLLLRRREPLFRGRDNVDQLGQIVDVLGVTELWEFVHKYQVRLSPEVEREMARCAAAATARRMANNNNVSKRRALLEHYCGDNNDNHHHNSVPSPPQPAADDGLDLLEHLLVYDPDQRWTAAQALRHPYFDAVRDRVHAELQQQDVVRRRMSVQHADVSSSYTSTTSTTSDSTVV